MTHTENDRTHSLCRHDLPVEMYVVMIKIYKTLKIYKLQLKNVTNLEFHIPNIFSHFYESVLTTVNSSSDISTPSTLAPPCRRDPLSLHLSPRWTGSDRTEEKEDGVRDGRRPEEPE